MKAGYTANLDHVRTCSTNVRSHTVQEVCHINNMRLFCHILKDRKSFCHRCCHHNVNRSSYAYHIKINVLSDQTLCFCDNLAMLDIHISTKRTKTFQMLVDWTASDIASSRKSDFCSFILTKKCSEQVIRCTDLLDVIIFYIKIFNVASVDSDCVPVNTVNLGTNSTDCFQQNVDIVDIRKIIDSNCLICHNRSCQNCQCCILCSTDLDFADQRIATLNNILFHFAPQLTISFPLKYILFYTSVKHSIHTLYYFMNKKPHTFYSFQISQDLYEAFCNNPLYHISV